jgi:hypothetical protein
MNMRGIVMSFDRKSAVVLLPDGEFRRTALRGESVRVGQEWEIPSHRSRIRYIGLVVSAALVLSVLALIDFMPFHNVQAAAIVSVDINPSINLNVSQSGQVVRAMGLDAGGRTVLSQKKVVGLMVPVAVQDLLQQAHHDGYLTTKSAVVIGAVFNKSPETWFGAVSRTAHATLAQEHMQVPVVTVTGVSPALINHVQQAHMSAGRYLLWHRQSRATQRQMTAQEVRTMPIGQLLAHTSKPPTLPGRRNGTHGSIPTSGLSTASPSNHSHPPSSVSPAHGRHSAHAHHPQPSHPTSSGAPASRHHSHGRKPGTVPPSSSIPPLSVQASVGVSLP